MMRNIPRPQSKQSMPDDAKCVFKGLIFDVYQYDQIQYDGSIKTFERLKRPDNTIVFPVFENGEILVYAQEQPGMKPFVGGFGGRVEEGEDPLEGAKRELLEALEYMVEVGVEFYDMECGQVGGGAIEQAQAAIEKAKGYKDE